MSTFEVSRETIVMVEPHPNADKLDLVHLKGLSYTIIGQRGTYVVGDTVALFMPESIIPQEMITNFGLTYLHKGNRVKTVKLRGTISEAMILPFTEVRDYIINVLGLMPPLDFEIAMAQGSPTLTEMLGVTKYEPEEPIGRGSDIKSAFPEGIERYDIEGIDKYNHIFDYMLSKKVIITEKLEGTNFLAIYDKDKGYGTGKRSGMVGEESEYHKAGVSEGIELFSRYICRYLDADRVAVRGELVGSGIQGNIYGFTERKIYVFDIKIDGRYIDAPFFYHLIHSYNDFYLMKIMDTKTLDDYDKAQQFTIKAAPVLFSGKLQDWADSPDKAKEASNGKSVLGNYPDREGIVIRPTQEEQIRGFGRLLLKIRSPQYLAAEK